MTTDVLEATRNGRDEREEPDDAAQARRRHLMISLAIFAVSVGGMAYLRLIVFPTTFVVLTYALPALVCIWHQDKRLLWGMSAAFVLLSAYKAFVRLPEADHTPLELWLHFAQQVVNVGLVAVVVHRVIDLTAGLRARNALIERQNAVLVARDEEITRQNEELTAQAEELAQQGEEIQQQAEEVTQQAEELQAQAEDLQVAYTESERREALLQALVESLSEVSGDGALPAGISRPLLSLFAGKAAGAIVAERQGDRFVALSHVNMDEYADGERRVEGSFGALVMEEGRTAFIEDLRARDDIDVVPAGPRTFRSALATPLRVDGQIVGVVEVVSTEP